ncbi:MAG: SAM-dependent methyltransferase [Acidimicrobiaceae bacterium]|nr:SAM-dependent methyltransferase [Acidimicrobiaceae bacterium]
MIDDLSTKSHVVGDTGTEPETPPPVAPAGGGAAALIEPLITMLLGDVPPVRFVFWDDSSVGPETSPGLVRVHSPDVLRRMLWSPDEIGVVRAFVAGELDVEGDLYGTLRALHNASPSRIRFGPRALVSLLRGATRTGALGRPLAPPPEEMRSSRLRRHSKDRDAAAIGHHYDVGNDFYRLVLGPSMTYSCARFETSTTSLEDAQAAKHDLVARKLGLHERSGARLLDIGCGWGSLAIHAAERYGAEVVGITLSQQQAELARARVKEAGLAGKVEIRLQDYRDLAGETFDAVSSIGMFEHVGSEQSSWYFSTVRSLLGPGGRLLNHAISAPGGSKLEGRTFMHRYVFPDGELIDVGEVALAMERAGFEVRDVESLREHYATTLRAWVANLEEHYDEAVALVGDGRARVWRFYMAASANGFEDGGLSVHQVLGVVPGPTGWSGMPRTRAEWG